MLKKQVDPVRQKTKLQNKKATQSRASSTQKMFFLDISKKLTISYQIEKFKTNIGPLYGVLDFKNLTLRLLDL